MPDLSRRRLLGGAAAVGTLSMAGAWSHATSDHSVSRREHEPGRSAVARGGNGMNVLLLIVDEVRRDHVGAYGSSVRTPTLDALAASGTRFTRPYAESMPTVPVRDTVFTGRRGFPYRHWQPWPDLPQDPGWQPVPRGRTTLAEMLGQVGYTRAVLADTPYYTRPSMNLHQGYDAWMWVEGQGFSGYGLPTLPDGPAARRYLPQRQGTKWSTSTARYLARALHWRSEDDWPVSRLYASGVEALGTLARRQPFLLVVDTYETHGPFFPPPAYLDLYGEYHGDYEPIQAESGRVGHLTSAQLDRLAQRYAGEITFTDARMGHLLDALEHQGLAESTLVVCLSDHGVLLGEHGYVGKPEAALYPELTDPLLLVRHPQRGHGTTSDVLASTHDVTPTVLSALDVRIDQPLDGADMLDPRSAVARREVATSIYAHSLWVRDDRHTLVAPHYGKAKHLFDHGSDPGFHRDLAAERPGVVDRLWRHVLADAGGTLPTYAT